MNEHNVWQFYQGEALEGFKESYARLSYLLKQIPKGSSVLNIGIGDGSFERLALEAGLNISSLDPDSESVESLSKRLNINAYCGSIENICLPSQSLDVVVVSEVLEHLEEDQARAGLKECARVLKNNGLLLGSVPADENIKLSIVVCPHCSERFHRWGHKQSFSEENLRNLLSENFPLLHIKYLKFIPWKLRKFPYLISGLLKIVLVKCGYKVQNANYVFTARKPL